MKSLFLSSLLALGLLAVPAQAAEYPAKPITLMTAFNAGGGSDVSHRLLEKFAKGVFDQPIVVTYKAGAGGEIGWTWLVGAKADGYTIGFFPTAALINGVAAGRPYTTEGIENVVPASDFRASGFDGAYGVLMADGPLAGLLARAVVVIDKAGRVVYTELVPEITEEPDYDKAVEAVKAN